MFYPNAQGIKTQIMDIIQTHHSAQYSDTHGTEANRNWSVVGEKRLKKLRKAAGVKDASDLPPIRVVVLDFGRVNHLDVTACLKLRELLAELRKYAGDRVEVRFVGLAPHVEARFERARPSWRLVDGDAVVDPNAKKDPKVEEVRVFRTVNDAVTAIRYSDVEHVLEEKMKADHVENV